MINACERQKKKTSFRQAASEQQRLPQLPSPQLDLQLAPPSPKRLLVLISAANWLLRSKPQILFFFRVSSRAVFPPKGERDGGRSPALEVVPGAETATFEHPTPLLMERLEPVAQDVGIIANICEAGGDIGSIIVVFPSGFDAKME